MTRCVTKPSWKLVSGMSLPGVERVEERLELRLVGWSADVAAVEHLHAHLAPRVLVEAGEVCEWNLLSRMTPSLPTRWVWK